MATYSPIPTHPGTPLTDEPTTGAATPRGGPAGPAIRIALPLLLSLAVVAALAVTLPPQHHSTAMDAYAPRATTVSPLRQKPSGDSWQATQYRLKATYGFSSLPQPVSRALGYGDDLSAPELQGQWLMVDLQGPTRELRTKAFHLGARRVTLQADLSADTWSTFTPGLPVLGVDLLAGRATTWAGTVTNVSGGGEQRSWQMSARLHTAPIASSPGCVRTTVEFTLADGARGTWTWTWCRGGRGFAGFTSGGQGFEQGTAGEAPPVELTARTPPPRLTGRVRELVAFRRTGGIWYETHLSSPQGLVRAGRSLVVASDTAVWSLRVVRGTGTELDRAVRWRAHPGGLITAMAAIGDQTVVATTDKQIVAYAANGWVRWRAHTTDTVLRLIEAGDTLLAVEGAAGLRALDARTGTTRWTWTGDEIVDVSAGGDLVVVAQDDGLVALGRTDGRRRWRAPAPDVYAVAVVAGTVVTEQARALIGRNTDGRLVWGHAMSGLGLGLWAAGDLVIVSESRATSAIRPSGATVWRTPGRARSVAVSGPTAAIALGDRIEVWGSNGRVTRWTMPAGHDAPLAGRIAFTDTSVAAYQAGPDGAGTWWAYG